MIGKIELMDKIEEFLSYYDKMDTDAHNRHDKRTESYALSMWCVFRSLKGKIKLYFRDHKYAKGLSEKKIFEILDERKNHFQELMKRDLGATDEYQRSLYNDHKGVYDCCNMAKKRLMTWMKNMEVTK